MTRGDQESESGKAQNQEENRGPSPLRSSLRSYWSRSRQESSGGADSLLPAKFAYTVSRRDAGKQRVALIYEINIYDTRCVIGLRILGRHIQDRVRDKGQGGVNLEDNCYVCQFRNICSLTSPQISPSISPRSGR